MTRGATTAAGTALALVLLSSGGGAALGQGPTATQSASATVGIREFSFRPATLKVDPGTTVVFANRDPVRHTATRGGSFDTGRIRPGKSKSLRFGSRGTYRYHCSIHTDMRGKIVVD
ncbi:MAG TPA: cupredoxin domain-containing protein [Solirubrobacterales bacterium]|nr:cupredoxin domain-containing protein [Solirubrobacterales bacterium]